MIQNIVRILKGGPCAPATVRRTGRVPFFQVGDQDVHKTLQDTDKVAQESHMMPEDGLRGLQGHTKTAQDTSKTAQDLPKTARGASETRCFDFLGLKTVVNCRIHASEVGQSLK